MLMNQGRRTLYPEIEPYRTGRMKVSALHEIYYEECGNPRGKPVVIVHGGPGGGCNPAMRRYHDPDRYRIVLFDQRGCGRSIPHACIEENTTWDLVEDMERLRKRLGVERWQLCGGSWGSTLSLAYAETHPERVSEMVLRGIFTVRRSELEWFYQEGCSWLFPDAFANYLKPIPPDERDDMIAAYYSRLTNPDRAVRLEAARAWSVWEGATLSLLYDSSRIQKFSSDDYALAFARIECHYFVNGGFFSRDDQLLAEARRLHGIPGVIIHGRYDVVTPVKTAFELKAAWPGAELRVIADAGHAMTEPGIAHEILEAADRYSRW
jgi:proline iminopeptidase